MGKSKINIENRKKRLAELLKKNIARRKRKKSSGVEDARTTRS
ncbi:hypothetical protein U370_02880 [Anaplasma marginale str. Dawn]|nr:hypothetical protein U128_02970 [Anaplasma marginale str. Gypsy Plains]AGZ80122.1 hypothetical protein U370_02880 [Anaplasma marginale str. Dawn]